MYFGLVLKYFLLVYLVLKFSTLILIHCMLVDPSGVIGANLLGAIALRLRAEYDSCLFSYEVQ